MRIGQQFTMRKNEQKSQQNINESYHLFIFQIIMIFVSTIFSDIWTWEIWRTWHLGKIIVLIKFITLNTSNSKNVHRFAHSHPSDEDRLQYQLLALRYFKKLAHHYLIFQWSEVFSTKYTFAGSPPGQVLIHKQMKQSILKHISWTPCLCTIF